MLSLKPDVIWVSSLFEGYIDDAVTGVKLDANVPVVVTIYDLIPLLNPEIYLQPGSFYTQFYSQKILRLKQADKCLAISRFSAHEACTALDKEQNWTLELSGGYDPQFRPLILTSEEKKELNEILRIDKPFVLYVGAGDGRKNLARLIQAYAQLSKSVRYTHHLLIVGKLSSGEIYALQESANAAGLKNNELILTGYVDDKVLVKLYNLCEVFIFPSWHEGFGLPMIEAMACGAVVIGANSSSTPEIIGRSEALFNPFDVASISQKLEEALLDQNFRIRLTEHGLAQVKKFSWDESAQRTLECFKSLNSNTPKLLESSPHRRLRLAFVSPLPAAQTGIADYSAELLPFLAKYYDIELVTAQKSVDKRYSSSLYTIRSPEWLRNNFNQIDRVIYHLGNSVFHDYMLSLIEDVPGVIVLHDFFLSGLYSYLELQNIIPGVWVEALYHSHGYRAIKQRYLENNSAQVIFEYPANLKILQYSRGVIVHSEYSRKLAQYWYGEKFSHEWKVIPHLRAPLDGNREEARRSLGIGPKDFLICSFGILAPTKLNDRLITAWNASTLRHDQRVFLIFVGDARNFYGQELQDFIHKNNFGNHIRITDRIGQRVYKNYLMAADLAVQLRSLSRGETSGSILDCMNNGLPVITNANGSFAELSSDAVWVLPDQFNDSELIKALETLYHDEKRRRELGKRAREIISFHHAPVDCAEKYAQGIEYFYSASSPHPIAMARSIALASGDFPTLTKQGRSCAWRKPSHKICLSHKECVSY